MQRVSALFPSWDRAKQTQPVSPRSPSALNKVFGWGGKAVVPVKTTQQPTSYDRETYWPTTLDKECDKAARILKSFCMDGFLVEEPQEQDPNTDTPSTQKSVTKKIPPRILQDAVGLAVFSCMRSGLWMSGSGGAGLITARRADGTWSPPSGIMLHTAGLGFVMGVDIYDCVLVINSVRALELFTRPKVVLGIDVDLTLGPLIDADSTDNDTRWKDLNDTVLTYIKARGKHQPVPLDGSLVSERGNENVRFYNSDVSVLDILAGNIGKEIPEMRPLFEVMKAAEGRTDYDADVMEMLAQQPAPSDAVIDTPQTSVRHSIIKNPFGIPDVDDPDPFGVIGLEMAGIEIREAGTRFRPTSTQFEFHPSPKSPAFARYSRQSGDMFPSRSNRESCVSTRSTMSQATIMTDACTQTDVTSTPETSFSRANSMDGRDSKLSDKLPTVVEPELEPEEIDYTQIDMSMIQRFRPLPEEDEENDKLQPEPVAHLGDKTDAETTGTKSTKDDASEYPESEKNESESERDEDADDEEDESDEDFDDEAIICEVATAQPARSSIRSSQITQVIHAKAGIVTIPKRIPPPLPAKSPARASRGSGSISEISSLKSPLRNSSFSMDSRMSDTLASAEASEAFVTPPAVMEEVEPASPEPVRRSVQGHQKNSSSVNTAVDLSAKRRASLETSPEVPATPRTVDLTSSAEESEREPKTPKTDAGFVNTTTLDNEKAGIKEVNIVSAHSAEADTVAIV
ncbi:hypothetical protein SMACR_09329 [Sordaria macrospora]|uniref:WGS project CABT00000000 data, contig 2.85 n=2 Tax=Sordaria macrospora TaxID=5147 RepID=F7WBU3_SORMK|nr:uncharacterized protein SMAC_09329 [Sordaria macrospora k-hell]KAA8622154.1 hypothetical protein SMACR_09329 [Sordaria macrospora]KAH7626140.1 hypothetical protein B0T09DRAFT_50384 [Sordaria sp. MPI-SDFR-AT-0083]WPJ61311.1 hypothetical protein SMAC4_09329 [Sordaria macrospora]CCC14486.1 unnamed protein product [Sordaria macrospora k-hell]